MWLSYLAFLAVLPIHEVFNVNIGFTLKLFNVFILLSFSIFVFRNMRTNWLLMKTPIDFWMWSFFAANLVSLIAADNHVAGARILFAILFMYLSYYMTIACVTDMTRFATALAILCWSAWTVSMYGIYQLVGFLLGYDTGQVYRPGWSWYPRLQSTMGEPAFFANFLLMAFPLLMAYLLNGQFGFLSRKKTIFFLICIFCALIMTMSKGTFLALGVMLPICFYGRDVGFAFKKLLPVGVFALLVVAGICVAIFSYSLSVFPKYDLKYLVYESFLNPDQGSYVERREANTTSWEMFLDHPWLGVGPANYGDNYNRYKPVWGQIDQFEVKLTPNNIALNLLAENGILGTVLFSGLLLTITVRTRAFLRSYIPGTLEHTTVVGLAYGFACMLFQYFFSAFIYFPHFWVVIGFLIAFMGMRRSEVKTESGVKTQEAMA
jgi:O-antigen ligase